LTGLGVHAGLNPVRFIGLLRFTAASLADVLTQRDDGFDRREFVAVAADPAPSRAGR
jgi:hypothetical protein